MEKVRLGRTGLWVSRVGIGGIAIQRPPLEEAVRVVRHALNLGVNFVDTALGYGDSEERMGKALAGRRDGVILATKGGWRDKETAAQHIRWSLQRLGTEHINLWQFHNISSLDGLGQVLAPGGALEAAQEALEAGKIRHIGFSSHNLKVALKAVSSGCFETVQFPLNLVAREAAEELVPLARAHDVGFIAMKPFAGGNVRDANLAIKYLLQFDGVVPDPGVQTADEIAEIVRIVDGSREITAQEWQQMDAIRDELGTRFCRQCMYCMPCPEGVEIWLLTYMRNLHRLWPLERFLEGWMADAAASGAKCVQCGACEEKCPYQLPIREMIVENVAFFERVKAAAMG